MATSRPGSRPAIARPQPRGAGKPNSTPSADTPPNYLAPTDDPDVFRNAAGLLVDKNGVFIGYAKSKENEDEIAERIIGGPVDSPAKLLKRVALDPTMPMALRLDAAKAAAPYFDKKTPVSVETKNEDFTVDVNAVMKLPRPERLALLKSLRTLGVDIGGTS